MRLFGNASVSALSVLALAAIVAACGSNSHGNSFNVTDGGSSSSGSSGGSGGDSGIGIFGDGGSSGGGKDSGPLPPKGCDSSCAAAGGKCLNNSCVIVDNAGMLANGTVTSLQGGGTADSTFTWLYPYDKTVFPRGLIPPKMQFNGISADSMYVHITCASLDYKGYYTPASGPIALSLSGPSWAAIVEATGAVPDQLKVDVTKISGGQVTGPITEHWPVAQGSLHGTIYYETYDSQLAGGLGSVGIMNIAPGATQPTVMKSGCGNVCHTASADGSTLVASQSLLSSASYDLKNAASQITAAGDERFTYGGLYPDGSMSMSATHYRTWIPGSPSVLYETATGAPLATTGWSPSSGGTITNAGTTAFSPDGKHIAFFHEDVGPHTLAMMDFDKATMTFSNLVDLVTDPEDVGWPAFTPDSKWIVYHSDTNAAFETDSGAIGDVFIVDVATKAVMRMDALNGYSGSGTQSYLPANDPNLSFAPTVLPEAVGGYFWVVFTSHRSYGNTLPTQQSGPSGPDEYGKLWVAAMDLNPKDGSDPSHPAFYLDGQEQNADNLRGFWVLPPCKGNGQSCVTGDQCCNGFCRPSGNGGPLECVAPPAGGCSNEYEKCTTASDCCNTVDQCINGFCAQPGAQ